MFTHGLNAVQGCNMMLAEVTAVMGGAWRSHSSVSWQQTSNPCSSSTPTSRDKCGPNISSMTTAGCQDHRGMEVENGLPQLSLPRLGGEEWSHALRSPVYQAKTPPTNKPPTVARIMQEFHRHSMGMSSLPAGQLFPRSRLAHICSRHYSSLSWRDKSVLGSHRNIMARASLSVRYFWSKLSRVKELENVANYNSKDEPAQLEYLQAVLDHDPEYVVRRVESGRYAINKDIVGVYLQALSSVSKLPSQAMMRTTAYAEYCLEHTTVNKSQNNASGSLSQLLHQPVQAEVSIKKTWSEEASFWIKRIIFTVFAFVCFITILNYSSLNSIKGASKEMQNKFSPDQSAKKYTFGDVEGVDEAKEEIMEIVDFLRNPLKYQQVGAKLPTGVLLVGPPGTGKTLLAKAVAGEANVPFLFVSGSEFDEIFVGVGATRLRKLFETARSLKPCVVFIDELDAVGGKRISSAHHPYSRQTLNQLLVEMDGYKELEGVIIIGATNFPEALDHALTRPGRFDTTITLSLPDVRARSKILEVHAKKVQTDPELDLTKMARNTAGFSGADLANLVNQAALRACVDDRDYVVYEDLEFARERLIMGREQRSKVISAEDSRNTAFHEAGHAIAALYTPGSQPIYKATIIPRGPTLGMVSLENNDIISRSKKQLLATIDVGMAGHVAEEITFGEDNVSTGATQDFRNVTSVATKMVTSYGMSKLGKFSHSQEDCSQAKRQQIDEEISRILTESYERTKALLLSHSVEHKRLAEGLLKYETLDADEIKLVIAGKRIKRDI